MAEEREAPLQHLCLQLDDERFALPRGITTIGRDPGSSVPLPHKLVSRHHAQIAYDGTVAVIEDTQSTCGTFVNAVEVSAPRPLREGDQIWIGSYSLQVCMVPISAQVRVLPLTGSVGCSACRNRPLGAQEGCADCRESERASAPSESLETAPPPARRAAHGSL